MSFLDALGFANQSMRMTVDTRVKVASPLTMRCSRSYDLNSEQSALIMVKMGQVVLLQSIAFSEEASRLISNTRRMSDVYED
jgi:hypothetical protein